MLKVLIVALVVLITANHVAIARQSGGLGDAQEATADTQRLVNSVRSDAEKMAGYQFEKFEAKQFKSQVVAGINYFIKVQVGDGKYVHLRVYQPLPFTNQPASLTDIQLNKTADDEIEYF